MFVHRLPWAVLVGVAAGLVCGNVQAAQPDSGTNNLPTSRQLQSVVKHTDYYLAKVPGTDQMRKVYYFASLDSNHNGGLERSELPDDMRLLRLHYLEADFDHNGRLSGTEYWMWLHDTFPAYTAVYHIRIGVWGR